jgi:hypothetical protein
MNPRMGYVGKKTPAGDMPRPILEQLSLSAPAANESSGAVGLRPT